MFRTSASKAGSSSRSQPGSRIRHPRGAGPAIASASRQGSSAAPQRSRRQVRKALANESRPREGQRVQGLSAQPRVGEIPPTRSGRASGAQLGTGPVEQVQVKLLVGLTALPVQGVGVAVQRQVQASSLEPEGAPYARLGDEAHEARCRFPQGPSDRCGERLAGPGCGGVARPLTIRSWRAWGDALSTRASRSPRRSGSGSCAAIAECQGPGARAPERSVRSPAGGPGMRTWCQATGMSSILCAMECGQAVRGTLHGRAGTRRYCCRGP